MRRAGAPDAGRAVVAAPQTAPPAPAQIAAARAGLGDAGRPAGVAAGLAGAVRSVLDDPGLAARLRAAATQRGAALPGATDAVDSVLAVYRRVLRAAGGRIEQGIQNRS